MKDAQDQLQELVKKRKHATYPIYVVLNSPGGSVPDGEDFIAYLKTLKNVHTLSVFSASMAAAIVEGNPGKRYMTETATLMFHRASVGLQGELQEVMTRLKHILKITERVDKRNAKRMGVSLKKYQSMIADELWLDSEEAVKLNAADETVDITCSQSLIDDRVEKEYATIFGMYKVSYSRCPLFDTAL